MEWNSSDDSSDECGTHLTFSGTLVAWNLSIYLCIIVIAAISNILLLFAIYKNPLKCFRNPTSYFIANLAVADLLNSLGSLEDAFVSQTKYTSVYCLPGVWGRINSGISNFVYFLTFPSVTILALERFVSIACPLWHKVKVTPRMCYIWIAMVWFMNCIFTAMFEVFASQELLMLTSYPSVFYLATVTIYILAFVSIRKQRFQLLSDNTKSETTKKMMKLRLRNQNRFLTTIFIINVVLIFGIIPTVVGTPLSYTLESETEEPLSPGVDVLSFMADTLFFLNMAVNPFLYIWRLPKYRKTFLLMYCCRK
jgi:hypothetical protein